MKRMLVHCHIFYPELWKELKACIKNINPYKFDLFVTMVEDHHNIRQDIQSCFPNAHIDIVKNVGYDVAPFVFVINKINLDDYSYVIKLHTKRSLINPPYFRNLRNNAWKEMLLSFIKTKDVFDKCIRSFEQDANIGMINNYKLLVEKDVYASSAQKKLLKFLNKQKLPVLKYRFVGGTMFIARAEIFSELQKFHLKIDDFPAPDRDHSTQLAHMLERFFGYSVYYHNMIVTDIFKTEKFIRMWLFYRTLYDCISRVIKRFFYQKKITKSGNLLIKICKIPIFSAKLKK